MKIKRKITAMLLAACLIVGLIPITSQTAMAAGSDKVWVGGVELTDSNPYLANNSSSPSATQPQSGGYAHWDANTNTLTLNNYTYSGKGYGYGNNGMVGESKKTTTAVIYSEVDFSIVLNGANSLANTDLSNEKILGNGIVAWGCNLTIKGPGTLDLSASYRGVMMRYADQKTLTIEGGKITITQNMNETIECQGIYSHYANVVIKGNTDITIDMGTHKVARNSGILIYPPSGSVVVNPTFTITDTAKVKICGPNQYGIYVQACDTTISGSAEVSILTEHDGGTNTALYGVYANNSTLTIKDSAKLTAKVGNNSVGSSAGIYSTKDILISDSSELTAESAGGQLSHGIFTNGALTINGTPTVSATAGTSTLAEQINAGIYADGAVSVNGGKLTAIGGSSAGISCGIYTVTGTKLGEATVNAIGGEASNNGYVRGLDGGSYLKLVPGTKGISVLIGDTAADTPLNGGAPFMTETALTGAGSGDNNYSPTKFFRSYPGGHTHVMKYNYTDETGHWQECSDAYCPDANKGKTDVSNHSYDNEQDATCICGYTRTINTGGSNSDDPSNPSGDADDEGGKDDGAGTDDKDNKGETSDTDDEDRKDEVADTGDESNLFMWILMACMAFVIGIRTLVYRR